MDTFCVQIGHETYLKFYGTLYPPVMQVFFAILCSEGPFLMCYSFEIQYIYYKLLQCN